jgi:hypothetical protein
MMPLTILELFSGRECISNAFRDRGHECLTLDYEKRFDPTYCMDIRDFTIDMLEKKKIDVMWASPDCTTFSVLAVYHYWYGGTPYSFPKRRETLKGIENVMIIVELLEKIRPKAWFMENPRAMMRTIPMLKGMDRKTVTYCSYGHPAMKPTDIWTNCTSFIPLKECYNGNTSCHHEKAAAGSNSGTQASHLTAEERSVIPRPLCESIVLASESYIEGGGGILALQDGYFASNIIQRLQRGCDAC